ncbi:ABC transporter permease [Leucobacter sp. HY1910]
MRFLIQRTVSTAAVLLLVSLFAFSILHLLPGDPALAVLGMNAPQEEIAQLREKMGLNAPILQQYGVWLWGVLHGDLGVSFRDGRPISGIILQRLPASLFLGVWALTFATFVGVLTGMYAALRRDRLGDWVASGAAMAMMAVPGFVLGLALIYLFAIQWHIFPAGGYVSPFENFGEHLRFMVLPVLTHAAVTIAMAMRMTRSSYLDVAHSDFMRTAWSKGLPRHQILFGHGLRNSLLPVVTLLGLQAGYLLGMAVVVEVVFDIPGIGKMLLDAVIARDYPLVQAGLLVVASIYVIANYLVDVFYAVLDPRIRNVSA